MDCINLSHKNLRSEDITKLVNNFIDISKSSSPQYFITTVKLGYNDLKDEGAAVVASFLKSNRTITCLDLGFNGIGDIGMESLSKALSLNVAPIQVLYLSGNLLTSVGFQSLSKSIALNNTLKTLYLTGNTGKEEGAKFISGGLEHNYSIDKLCLNGNKIGSLGSKSISQLLLRNHTITHINLVIFFLFKFIYQLTINSLNRVITIFRTMVSLTWLNLYMNIDR